MQSYLKQDEATSVLLAFVFSRAIGSAEGKCVGYSLIEERPEVF